MRPSLLPAVAIAGLVAAAGAALLVASSARREGPASPRGAGWEGRPAGGIPATVAAGPGDLFEDVTARSGLDFVLAVPDGTESNVVEAAGAGGAVLDVDGDGWMDVLLLQPPWIEGASTGERPAASGGSRLFRNRGDGTFEDVTARSGAAAAVRGAAAAAADFDGDGRTDLYVAGPGPDVLLRNRGDGTFEDATARSGLGDPRCGVGACFLEADGDGRPDLYVANYVDLDAKYRLFFPPDGFPGPLSYEAEPHSLWRNRGDGTFEDVSGRAGVRIGGGRGMGVAAADLDGDGDQDLYVANDASPNWLFRNDGGMRFTEVGLESGTAYGMQGEATAAMAGIPGDYDGDGLPDLFVSDGTYGSLFRNRGGLRFEDRVFASGLAAARAQSPAWGATWIDHDDDGDEDLFVASGDLHHPVGREDFLFENLGDGKFRDASREGGAWFRIAANGRACLPADFDNDGRVDVLLTNLQDRAVLLRNRGRGAGAWLTVALEGLPPNTGALGAKVSVTAGGRTRTKEANGCPVYLGQGDPRLHFGLGAAETVGRVSVRWPSGQETVLEGVPARRILRVREEAAR